MEYNAKFSAKYPYSHPRIRIDGSPPWPRAARQRREARTTLAGEHGHMGETAARWRAASGGNPNERHGLKRSEQRRAVMRELDSPDHFHLYEEVICILDGTGIMHAGESSTPISTGSCIFLPRKQRHCVENTGPGELRLLGVFYPAGSPAVRYPA